MIEAKFKAKVRRLTSPYTATGELPVSDGSEVVDRLLATKSISDKEAKALEGAIALYKVQSWKTSINKGQKGTEMNIFLTFTTSFDAEGFKDVVTEKVVHLSVI